MTTCDYHDLPVVCGECGRDAMFRQHMIPVPAGIHPDFHAFHPVHRIPDPEGIEGTAVVPCGEAE
jgi:hypothetical protein